jgi:5-methylcytosine-specific restriction endonuclease McrA
MPRAYRPSIPEALRAEVIERKGRHCAYCGTGPLYKKRLHLDHVVPVTAGGQSVFANLLPCCKRCNSAKLNASLDVYLTRRIPALERELGILRAIAALRTTVG